MEKYYDMFASMPLFTKIPMDKYQNVLCCLQSKVKKFEKGETIFDYHEPVKAAGIVLVGKVNTSLLNKTGAAHNIREFGPGELFAESFACVSMEKSNVKVTAIQKSTVLFLTFSELFSESTAGCPYAAQVSLNILYEASKKNIFLSKKVEILTQKKIRDKIILYLCTVKFVDNGTDLPFNRQGLADYLGVERSALSRELSAMKKEGLIEYNKSRVTILSKENFID